MHIGSKLWSAITYLASYLTLSPVGQDVAQQPLPVVPEHNAPAISSVAAPINALGYPEFKPPSGRPLWEGSDFKCSYPEMKGYKPCSTPENRTCWLRNEETGHAYTINTDYENEKPVGILRNYTLVIEDGEWNADGLWSKDMKLANGTYPGPWIQACWGDRLVVNVINKLKHNGTAIHFHGIRQNRTMHMDGVPGITQCPIAPNDYFVYDFPVTQYGSSWYHSHYSVQYADGLLGPMTLHGPSTDHWDEPKLPIIMSDWFHNSAFAVIHKTKPGYPTIVVNGTGDITKHTYSYLDENKKKVYYNVTPNAPIPPKYQLHFQKTEQPNPARRYLLRIINTSFTTTFTFSIDNHRLIIIGADFVPMNPTEPRTHIQVGIGQRYTVIVVAEPDHHDTPNPALLDGNYWIRTTVSDCFGSSAVGTGFYDRTGVLRYGDSVRDPITKPWSDVNSTCKDETGMVPRLRWNVKPPSNGNHTVNGTKYGEEFSAHVDSGLVTPKFPLGSWSFLPDGNDKTWNPLQIDYDNPFFLNLNKINKTDWPKAWVVIPENYTQENWIYLAITGMKQRNDASAGIVAHPIHLHGHDFAVMQQENYGAFPPAKFNFQYDNPLRRDVVLLPKNGWVVIAFKADNPGSWIMHCHIAFHASEGLALQINERQKEADDIWPNDRNGTFDSAIIEAKRVCKRWNDFQADCTQHWPGKDEARNCWPACSLKKPEEKIYACDPNLMPGHVFQDDSGI